MTERIGRLMRNVEIVRSSRIPVGVEKAQNITASFRGSEGEPHIVRCAKAFAAAVEGATLFIEEDMLLVGNPASQPWGVELTPLWGTWPEAEIDSLEAAGYIIHPEVRQWIGELNDYWQGRSLTSLMTGTYDDERLWPYAQMGVVLPPFKSKEEGWGAGGLLGGGYGFHHEISQMIGTPDFATVLERGLGALVSDVADALRHTRLYSAESFEQAEFYRAALISLGGVQTLIRRFEAIARHDANQAEEARRRELEEIAEICAHIVEGPARTFREALQLYWFLFVSMLPSGTLGMGRIDQLFYPWYRRDVDAGILSDEQVVELFAMLRLRSMEITIQGGSAHRAKWAGGSKWHNAVIGGQNRDGSDATNELSYLVLRAAEACPTPHHTITMRVHDGTPSELLQAALRLARTGLGMPAFVGDRSMIGFLEDQGIDGEEARDYSVAGSLSVTITGKSRLVASPMFVLPRVLDIAMRGGICRRTGFRLGPATPVLGDHASFDQFLESFRLQMRQYLGLQAEFNNVTIRSIGDRYPRPLDSVLMADGVALGADVFTRTMPYENANFVNVIGVVNVADSLHVIRTLVFDERAVTAERLIEAIDRDWAGDGDDELRERCRQLAKFGNADADVDALAAWAYQTAADAIVAHTSVTGGRCIPSALTIGTSPWPGGAVTGATPDGRSAGEPLAEESLTPMRGVERATPWHVIASASRVGQRAYQSVELDLRFEAAALAAPADLGHLEDLLRDYFSAGGKHVQINVADTSRLRAACLDPESHPDLTVRLGGTTAYFAQLSPDLRDEILQRHYFDGIAAKPDGLELTMQ